jgi:hypothetical protein
MPSGAEYATVSFLLGDAGADRENGRRVLSSHNPSRHVDIVHGIWDSGGEYREPQVLLTPSKGPVHIF